MKHDQLYKMNKKKGNILIADDDQDILFSATLMLEDDFENIFIAESERAILNKLEKNHIDVLLLDMNFSKGATSGKQGLLILEKVMAKYPQLAIVMSTSFGDIDLAVTAMQKGAKDFVTKPWDNIKLIEKLSKVLNSITNTRKPIPFHNQKQKEQRVSGLVYVSQEMKKIHHVAEKVAVTESNVLILGENGTGKGLLAREIHLLSNRREEPFVQIDLGSLSESLFESELFGHAKGAFTDAQAEKKGRLEAADGGTLFLDEIGNLTPVLQAKMLSVIQNKVVVRLGETKERPINFRLITATNMPLQDMIVPKENGLATFRSDLFFRINTVTIDLPPLKKRTADILPLAYHFLKEHTQSYQKRKMTFTVKAEEALKEYHWPGNIRELSHVIEQAIIFADNDVIESKDFHLQVSKSNALTNGDDLHANSFNLEEIEKQTIVKLLTKYQGNITKVAKELGIGRTTLYRKMDKYKI